MENRSFGEAESDRERDARFVPNPNSEPLNIRIPKDLKEELKILRRFQMVSSVGELIREVLRGHVRKEEGKDEYKWWLKEQHRQGLDPKTGRPLPHGNKEQ
jgi:hypothetical protein